MMNQKTATVSTILSVLEERGVEFELNGPVNVGDVLTDADKTKIREIIFAGFRAGKIEMAEESKAKYAEDSALKSYVSGLVNNWIRKEKTLNGGNTYQAKNPGSRAGSGDEKIREMKKLLSQVTDPTKRQLIESAISQRQAEIAAEKAPAIDVSKLPEHLRDLLK